MAHDQVATSGWILPGLNGQSGVGRIVKPLVITCCCDAEQSATASGKTHRCGFSLR